MVRMFLVPASAQSNLASTIIIKHQIPMVLYSHLIKGRRLRVGIEGLIPRKLGQGL